MISIITAIFIFLAFLVIELIIVRSNILRDKDMLRLFIIYLVFPNVFLVYYLNFDNLLL